MRIDERVDWLRRMWRIRRVEERIRDEYPQQQMRCPVHLCIGQEAIAVGVCARLNSEDLVFSNHRSHGHYLAKGGSLPAFIAELYGRADGCASGRGGSMHLRDASAGFVGSTPIVASTIPIAVGYALGVSLRGERRVVVTFFGEGATEEGVFHESVNFAAVRSLPIVFVCENNLYSVYSPLPVRQPAERDLVQLARAHGIAADRGDGNDVGEVARITADAVHRAHEGQGPSLVEFSTYRWLEHCGPSDDTNLGYRNAADVNDWKTRCPIATLTKRLLDEDVLSQSDCDEMAAALDAEIESSWQQALRSPVPDATSLHDHIVAGE